MTQKGNPYTNVTRTLSGIRKCLEFYQLDVLCTSPIKEYCPVADTKITIHYSHALQPLTCWSLISLPDFIQV